MSRKAKGQQVGVALFPFLAVLICTMGALIVLLVLLVQQARVDASAVAAAQIGSGGGEAPQRIRERIEDAQWQREMLEKSRAEKTDELSQQRSRVAHIEEHKQRLAAQAKELLDRAKAIDEGKKLRDEDMAAARAEAAKLKAEIEKEELEKAKKKAPDGQEWYALIPYDGRSGTRRRPIYVECTEFGVVIQPEGLRLTTEDFSGPLGPGNPLDSALRAIRDYWERTAGTKAAQPYPLLVVRPSGVVAFGAAKAAISAWDDEWGYELISDDKNIDFGPPDPGLNTTLNKTVTIARQRQAAMIAMMPRRFQGDEPLKSFAPEPTIGANGSRYVGGSGSGPGGGAGAGSGGVGNGSGFGGSGVGSNGVGNGTGNGGGTAGPAGGGMARGGNGNGLGSGNGGVGGSGYGANGAYAGGGGPGGYGGGTGSGPAGYGAAGGGGPGGTSAAGGNGTAGNGIGGNGYGGAQSGNGLAANGTGSASNGGAGSGGSGASGSGIPSVAAAWDRNATAGDQRFGAANRSEPGMIGAGGGGAGGSEGFPGSQPAGNGTGAGGNGAGGGQGGSGQYASSGGQAGGSAGGQGGSTSGGQSGGSSSSSAGGSSAMSSGGSQGGGSSIGGGSSMTSSSGGMGVPSFNFGGAKNSQSGTGGGGKSGSGGPRSTAKRGNNWGLPQAKVNQIGVTRPIHVSIEPNRVVMYPERGDNRAPKVVPIALELSPDDVTHFVDAVQGEVKGWGVAVSDGYWKPVLRADIAPGAERQFMNLETALHGSGIEVTRR